MDRSWVHARLFTLGYIDGVKEFMSFIHEKFGEDEAILCPCSRCLNQKYQHQSVVERHILMYGMESTYTRWIHHGENFNVDVVEHPVVVHDHAGGSIQGLGVTENDNNGSLQGFSVSEDDDSGAINFDGLLQDLCTTEKEYKQDGEDHDGNSNADPGDNESFSN
jgi:hypothetical protein